MKDLTALPNIGKVLAQKLIQVGVTTPAQLQSAGSKQVFKQISEVDETACIQMLYSLQGAIESCKYTELSTETKRDLKGYFDTVMA
ncbi:TfoX/Sxy family DNA transformation protein [Lactiplantibacillus herbarum]|uniref:TfoX/Sxy family DNA transformation protein n=1 Tax=Lactiplantibacillus herbarum TaxID=1670446 RepID=UPI00064F057E|nr:TfoX/Sxy family DNA transformation protein [Lactiplantibacillus herbarum]